MAVIPTILNREIRNISSLSVYTPTATPAIMIFSWLVISAIAVLLGSFVKVPQGSGGLVNNLAVMTFFLPSLL